MVLKKRYNIPIYFGYLDVIVFSSEEELLKKHNFGEEFNSKLNSYSAFVTNMKVTKSCEVFSVFLRPDAKPSTMAHEAGHLIHQIFRDRGVYVSYDHDEHYCYFLAWLVDQMDKTLKIYNNK